MTVEKPKPKQLPRPITTGADSAMNQSQLLAITCNSLKVREKSRAHNATGFGFASHWFKNWRESFKPITKRSNYFRQSFENCSILAFAKVLLAGQFSWGDVYKLSTSKPRKKQQLQKMWQMTIVICKEEPFS